MAITYTTVAFGVKSRGKSLAETPEKGSEVITVLRRLLPATEQLAAFVSMINVA